MGLTQILNFVIAELIKAGFSDAEIGAALVALGYGGC